MRPHLRHILIRLLGGVPSPEEDQEDQEDLTEVIDSEVVYVLSTEEGSEEIVIPPGADPIQALKDHVQQRRENLQIIQSPTVQIGPAGKYFDMRTVDCAEEIDPLADREIQNLLQTGWEPFSTQKQTMISGKRTIRIYLKRECHPRTAGEA